MKQSRVIWIIAIVFGLPLHLQAQEMWCGDGYVNYQDKIDQRRIAWAKDIRDYLRRRPGVLRSPAPGYENYSDDDLEKEMFQYPADAFIFFDFLRRMGYDPEPKLATRRPGPVEVLDISALSFDGGGIWASRLSKDDVDRCRCDYVFTRPLDFPHRLQSNESINDKEWRKLRVLSLEVCRRRGFIFTEYDLWDLESLQREWSASPNDLEVLAALMRRKHVPVYGQRFAGKNGLLSTSKLSIRSRLTDLDGPTPTQQASLSDFPRPSRRAAAEEPQSLAKSKVSVEDIKEDAKRIILRQLEQALEQKDFETATKCTDLIRRLSEK